MFLRIWLMLVKLIEKLLDAEDVKYKVDWPLRSNSRTSEIFCEETEPLFGFITDSTDPGINVPETAEAGTVVSL